MDWKLKKIVQSEMCILHIWKIYAFSNFSVTKLLQSNSCKFELPKYTMMWSLTSEWQAKNLSIFLAYYVIFKLATSVFQRCFDWMDTFVLKVQKMELLKVKEKGGEGDDIWQKLAVLLRSKAFMIKLINDISTIDQIRISFEILRTHFKGMAWLELVEERSKLSFDEVLG